MAEIKFDFMKLTFFKYSFQISSISNQVIAHLDTWLCI